MDRFIDALVSARHYICAAAAVVGGCVASVTGGWTQAMTALVILMCIDYIMGIVVALAFQNSPKSKSGGLNSQVGWKGLARKVFTMCLVVVAHQVDIMAGTTLFRDAAVIGFGVNEIISIIENAGLMGIHMPKIFDKAIDVLQGKGEKDEG